MKVVGAALRQYPRANVSFVEGRIKVHPQVNIGVAVGSDGGLVVPVIKEADQKSLTQITRELKALREKAQQMRFSAEDLAGGTFTISNLGMCGIDHFTAIINPPQSAILAVGQIIKAPVGMPDDTIALRPMMCLTLTVDHRAMDGLQGARFLAEESKKGLKWRYRTGYPQQLNASTSTKSTPSLPKTALDEDSYWGRRAGILQPRNSANFMLTSCP